MEKKIKVGQKVWIKEAYPGAESNLKEAIVSKVGRKYFELEKQYYTKFDIEKLIEAGHSNYKSKIYLSPNDYYEEIEHLKLSQEIRKSFSPFGKSQYTLSQLRQIAEIIGINSNLSK